MFSGFGVLVMSLLLGAVSFTIGILPLSITFSKARLAGLSAFGSGLLLGAALGIIIPEGVETLAAAHPATEFPTTKIAFSLLLGFTFMLVVEQSIASHPSPRVSSSELPSSKFPQDVGSPTKAVPSTSEVQFDAELDDLEDQPTARVNGSVRPIVMSYTESRKQAFPLTIGLVIHGLADGIALGVSALSDSPSGVTSDLSLVVFMALIIHKAPTTIAFSMSLLSTELPRADCKKYIAIFSSSTPFGALVSYVVFSFLGASDPGNMSGLALLVSGGSFLYVATVLQPASHHSEGSAGDIRKNFRILLTVMGMMLPFLITLLVGHGHDGHAEENSTP